MRIFVAILCLSSIGCELGELLHPTPMCPKRIAFDTAGYAVIIKNGMRIDSIPITINTREVCTTTRYTEYNHA